MQTGSRLRQIGWAMVLTVCVTAFMALTFHVNAIKSKVRLAERQIVALERDKLLLETEFQARANQQQLANWNRIEFGYVAPSADQYLASERQLASLGVPRDADAPDPIRVARAPVEQESDGLLAMMTPDDGRVEQNAQRPAAMGLAERAATTVPSGRSLAERLARENPIRTSAAEVAQ